MYKAQPSGGASWEGNQEALKRVHCEKRGNQVSRYRTVCGVGRIVRETLPPGVAEERVSGSPVLPDEVSVSKYYIGV